MVTGKKLSRKKLTDEEIEQELLGLSGWRFEDGSLKASFETGDFNAGVALVTRIAEPADKLDHHPDIKLTYPKVEVQLKTHDVDGITEFDFELARQIDELR